MLLLLFILNPLLPTKGFSNGNNLGCRSAAPAYIVRSLNRINTKLKMLDVDTISCQNVVNNYTNLPLDRTVALILSYFKISGVQVDILYYQQAIKVDGVDFQGFLAKGDLGEKHYQVFLSSEAQSPLKVLMHELCHLAQAEEGELVYIDNYNVKFKGKEVDLKNTDYACRPHEVDAFLRERRLIWTVGW